MLEPIAMETPLKSFPTVTPSNQALSASALRCFNLKCCVDTRVCVEEQDVSHRTIAPRGSAL